MIFIFINEIHGMGITLESSCTQYNWIFLLLIELFWTLSYLYRNTIDLFLIKKIYKNVANSVRGIPGVSQVYVI